MNKSEEHIWEGRPKQGVLFAPRDVFMIPFSLIWCGFAIFWTITAMTHGAPFFFGLWGGMFILVGLYFVVGRFIHDAVLRSKTTYVITRSGLTISRNGTDTVIPLGHWTCLEMTTFKDRSGTIRFAPRAGLFTANNFGVWVPILESVPQFYRIEDPERVMRILGELGR